MEAGNESLAVFFAVHQPQNISKGSLAMVQALDFD
jgi:hypothetical protein